MASTQLKLHRPGRETLNIIFTWVVLACLCIPALAYGQAYKCKNPDGTVSFSDQPCPGSLGAPTVDNNSDTSKIVEDLLLKKHPTKEETDRLFLRYDKDFYENGRRCKEEGTMNACKDALKALNGLNADQAKLCKNGNMEACKITCDGTLYMARASADEFLTCAKVKKLIHGDYWLLTQGRPTHNSEQLDPGLVADALTPRFPAGKHNYGNMTMKCFRKKISVSKVEAVDYKVDENLYVSRGANGPVFRRTFSLEMPRSDKIVQPVMPEFQTLQELANNICER